MPGVEWDRFHKAHFLTKGKQALNGAGVFFVPWTDRLNSRNDRVACLHDRSHFYGRDREQLLFGRRYVMPGRPIINPFCGTADQTQIPGAIEISCIARTVPYSLGRHDLVSPKCGIAAEIGRENMRASDTDFS